MKNLYVLLIALFSFIIADAQWTNQQSGTTSSLRSVRFTKDKVGYVAGGTGTILKTTNNGLDWSSQISGTKEWLYSVFPVDSNICYIVGDHGTILKTMNGGATWTPQISGTSESLRSSFFSCSDTGIVVGTNGIVLTTTDGGQNWTPIISGITASLSSLCFTSKTNGYMMGYPNHIYRTTDRGLHWIELGNDWFHQITYSYDRGIHSVFFTDSLNGYAIGNSGAYQSGGIFNILDRFVTNTKDGGLTWNVQHNFYCDYGVLFFTDAQKGYAVGWGGKIMRTTDSGISWFPQTSGTSNDLNSVFFADSLNGFAVGAKGVILYTNNGGTKGINEQMKGKTIGIYPNPTKDFITIEMNQVNSERLIILSNVCGQELFRQKAESDKILVDLCNLKVGIYLLKIISGDSYEVRKVMKK